ncbi:hypothetical protein [Sphingomonas sp. 22176]|uniref:hypothetical protein n=1 Tax=Sphingomonas sp. 22176 TaxID=3453884 RepID=UPI003F827C6D
MSRQPGYNSLMHEVCVEGGWCGAIVQGEPSHVDDFIPAAGPVTAEQFVEWLFRAEGVDPSSDPAKWGEHWEGLRGAFVRHLGADLVEASALKCNVG